MGEGTCRIDGCPKLVNVKAHRLCWGHYKRQQRHGDAATPTRNDKDALTRFFERVDIGDCWEWTASKTNGYGYFMPPGHPGNVRAHRWLYEQLVGQVPDGLELDHLCRNRCCVNPDHLEPVTGKENTRRGYSPSALNARKTRCPQGHEYTEDNTRLAGNGGRGCKICWNAWRREYRVERRAAGAPYQ